MIYSSWDIEENILKLVILGHFLKNEKTCSRYHHFTHVYQKSQSFDVWFLRYEVRWTEFFAISSHFLPFYHHSPSPPPLPPLKIPKIKILKKKTLKMPGDVILLYIHMYHKWRSYDKWFLNIRSNRKFFLSFWAICCLFKIEKKHLEILSF